jgi:hypothetical protein
VSQVITLELRDEVYSALQRQAASLGIPVSEWITIALDQHSGLPKQDITDAEKQAARQRFQRHAGAIDLGYPTGADNDSIDADLLKAYSGDVS